MQALRHGLEALLPGYCGCLAQRSRSPDVLLAEDCAPKPKAKAAQQWLGTGGGEAEEEEEALMAQQASQASPAHPWHDRGAARGSACEPAAAQPAARARWSADASRQATGRGWEGREARCSYASETEPSWSAADAAAGAPPWNDWDRHRASQWWGAGGGGGWSGGGWSGGAAAAVGAAAEAGWGGGWSGGGGWSDGAWAAEATASSSSSVRPGGASRQGRGGDPAVPRRWPSRCWEGDIPRLDLWGLHRGQLLQALSVCGAVFLQVEGTSAEGPQRRLPRPEFARWQGLLQETRVSRDFFESRQPVQHRFLRLSLREDLQRTLEGREKEHTPDTRVMFGVGGRRLPPPRVLFR
ncbi:unnamed protein product [Prorocentrum cordatum]|uniref:Uncharacterized protein n=1 Tax=Prorocentrum cordatum TaxID=2364126 RepID=A0ABN9PIT3_9DINO|nr:unnamed protein product [Polarella glacialis]